MGFSTKPLILDGKDHLLGRLASIVAKQLLMGQRVVVVRCEDINISGNFYRNKLKYLAKIRKRCNVNPKRGPFHFRAPGKMFTRVVRGMLPHKQFRGTEALKRLKAVEGVPPPYDRIQKFVVPVASRVNCLKPRRKYCQLGRIAHEIGWQHKEVIAKLEAKRKVKSAVRFHKKKADSAILRKATKNVAETIAPYQKIIESFGFR